MEIWIVSKYGGDYEDKWDRPVKAFQNKAKANAWADSQSNKLREDNQRAVEEVQEYHKLLNKLGVESDDLSDEEYYAAEDKLMQEWVAQGKATSESDAYGYRVEYYPVDLELE